MAAIRTEEVGRIFSTFRGPDVVALRDVDVAVEVGEMFGLLGPNGAGKTTLIKILTTLLLPSSGRAWVDGLDVTRDVREVRWRIGMVSGGETSGYGLLTVREQLWMFSQFYGMPSRVAKRRINDLLDIVGLSDVAGRKMHSLSTGMRQKMNLVRGILSDPKVLFLDEPTLGLDVEIAREVRSYLQRWITQEERTVLLTTHHMAEADEMCDRIAIINDGTIVVTDTADALKKKAGFRERYRVEFDGEAEVEPLARFGDVETVAAADGTTAVVTLAAADGGQELMRTAAAMPTVRGLTKEEPTLEDAFVALTGRGLDDT